MTGGDGKARGESPRASLFAGHHPNQNQMTSHADVVVADGAPVSPLNGMPSPVQAQPVYPYPQMMAPAKPKMGLMQALQSLTMLGNILIFAYIFLGELFLPDHMRATTFLGKRIGGIQGETAIYAAPQQAEAATIVDTAKANVEVKKQCEILRRSTSLGVYNQCLGQPNGSHPLCQIQQQMFLDTYQCNEAGEILNLEGSGF